MRTIEVEEILLETDTAFLVQFLDGTRGWLTKSGILGDLSKYRTGKRHVVICMREGG